jgi:mRNA-degrading endonuclease RelE of RelBE toxin-antitoxin system
MNYTIAWLEEAQDQLAAVWMAADDPRAVNDAVEFLERLLRYAPLDQGESRSGDLRIVFSDPIGVLYRVDQDRRTVLIVSVGPSGRTA